MGHVRDLASENLQHALDFDGDLDLRVGLEETLEKSLRGGALAPLKVHRPQQEERVRIVLAPGEDLPAHAQGSAVFTHHAKRLPGADHGAHVVGREGEGEHVAFERSVEVSPFEEGVAEEEVRVLVARLGARDPQQLVDGGLALADGEQLDAFFDGAPAIVIVFAHGLLFPLLAARRKPRARKTARTTAFDGTTLGAVPSYEYYRRAFEGRRLPLAFCDLALLDENIAALAARAAGTPIRVASKSLRCRAVLERVLRHDGFSGVMCFTAAEAAFLAERGFDDLLVAYPTLEAEELALAAAQVAKGKTLTLTVDDRDQLPPLERAAAAAGQKLGLCLDVDMSSALPGLWFGVRRSPLREVSQALRLGEAIRRSGHLELRAVMGYEAQVAGLQDAIRGKAASNLIVRGLKRHSIREFTRRRGAIVKALRADGHPIRVVNGGGTGSLESTGRDPSITEVTAGSGFYAPTLFDGFAGFRHRPAAGFALPVVRRPTSAIVTCHGGGYVASGAAGRDKLPQPFLPRGGSLLPLEGAGEVQTPVAFDRSTGLRLGDPVLFRHAKAGELCERFDRLALVMDGTVVDEAPTYRGDGRTFL